MPTADIGCRASSLPECGSIAEISRRDGDEPATFPAATMSAGVPGDPPVPPVPPEPPVLPEAPEPPTPPAPALPELVVPPPPTVVDVAPAPPPPSVAPASTTSSKELMSEHAPPNRSAIPRAYDLPEFTRATIRA
jgi:hypothetical protein